MRSNGPAIRALRERSGLSQTKLAELSEQHRTLIVRLEGGTRAGTPAQLCAIAKALQVPLLAITLHEEAQR